MENLGMWDERGFIPVEDGNLKGPGRRFKIVDCETGRVLDDNNGMGYGSMSSEMKAVRSASITSSKGDERWVVIDMVTGRMINDCGGNGFKNAVNALKGTMPPRCAAQARKGGSMAKKRKGCNLQAVISTELSAMSKGDRWVIIDPDTGEVVNDAGGYGFKTESSARKMICYEKGKQGGSGKRRAPSAPCSDRLVKTPLTVLDILYDTGGVGLYAKLFGSRAEAMSWMGENPPDRGCSYALRTVESYTPMV